MLGVLAVIKSKRRTRRSLADEHGKAPAEVVLGEGSFALHAPGAPGVHADGGEIAGLSFSAPGCRDHVLRLGARGIGHGIEFCPGHDPPARGPDIIADRTRSIEFYEPRKNPADNRNGGTGIRLSSGRGWARTRIGR